MKCNNFVNVNRTLWKYIQINVGASALINWTIIQQLCSTLNCREVEYVEKLCLKTKPSKILYCTTLQDLCEDEVGKSSLHWHYLFILFVQLIGCCNNCNNLLTIYLFNWHAGQQLKSAVWPFHRPGKFPGGKLLFLPDWCNLPILVLEAVLAHIIVSVSGFRLFESWTN